MSTSSSSAGSSLTESSPRHSVEKIYRNFLHGKVSQNVTFAIASIRLIIVDFVYYANMKAFWFTVTKPVYRILYRISYYTK
jgi:hypothetical protein